MIKQLRYMIKKALKRDKRDILPGTGVIPKSSIAGFLPREPIIVEAGAHIGLDTVKLAELFPHGKIYAFEPVPHLYEQLVTCTKRYKNIVCSPLTLGEFSGRTTMYVS